MLNNKFNAESGISLETGNNFFSRKNANILNQGVITMNKGKSTLVRCFVVVMMLSIFVTSAYADDSAYSQMAANSAAWWVAHNAGDTATCNNLAAANQAIAGSLNSPTTSTSYNDAAGTWTINSGGTVTTSTNSENGKSSTVTYVTSDSSGSVTSSTSSSSYTTSSIDAYLNHGGTTSGLVTSYNNAAESVTARGRYGTIEATTSAYAEAAIAKALLGLSDSQATALQTALEKQKVAYETASAAYDAATTEAEKAAALAAMNTAHSGGADIRTQYGYSADKTTTGDGGYFFHGTNGGTSGAGITTQTIISSAGMGGTISPSGNTTVTQGAAQTYTITASAGYKIATVLVDGASVGAVSSYTFSNVTAAHTISAIFASAATLSGGTITLGDGGSGTISSITGGYQMKSGYGFTASAKVTSQYVSNITVTASYKFISAGTTALENTGSTFQFPVNNSSATKARKVYVPVDTKDGTYTITFTIKALDPQATALTGSNVYLTATKTVTLVIKGSMHEDDFTGDS